MLLLEIQPIRSTKFKPEKARGLGLGIWFALVLMILGIAGLPVRAAEVETGAATTASLRLFQDIPEGRLGYVLGSYLTIEAQVAATDDPERFQLLVQSVNGHVLPYGVSIRTLSSESGADATRGKVALQHGTAICVNGYERGQMVGMPEAIIRAEPEVEVPTVQWQFLTEFVITSAAEKSAHSQPAGPAPRLQPTQHAQLALIPAGLPPGQLGEPLGTYLTIEGTRPTEFVKLANPLRVDAVNGKQLAQGVVISLAGVTYPKSDGRYILRGFESAYSNGIPPEVQRRENITNLPSAGWGFYRSFNVTSTVQPLDLQPAPNRGLNP